MPAVDTIINHAIGVANLKAAQSEAYMGQAVNAATGGSVIQFNQPRTPNVSEPNVAIPSRAVGIDQALWDSTYSRIVDDLSDKFAQFFVDFFPVDPDLMAAVEEWLRRAVADGARHAAPL